jgi:hypothetical protein
MFGIVVSFWQEKMALGREGKQRNKTKAMLCTKKEHNLCYVCVLFIYAYFSFMILLLIFILSHSSQFLEHFVLRWQQPKVNVLHYDPD